MLLASSTALLLPPPLLLVFHPRLRDHRDRSLHGDTQGILEGGRGLKVWDKKGGSILELKLKGKFGEEWKNEEFWREGRIGEFL